MGKTTAIKFKPPTKPTRPSAGPRTSVTEGRRGVRNPAEVRPMTSEKRRQLICPDGPSTTCNSSTRKVLARERTYKEAPGDDVYTFKSSSPVKAAKYSRRDERMRKLARKRDIMQGVLNVISRTRHDIAKLRAVRKKVTPEQ